MATTTITVDAGRRLQLTEVDSGDAGFSIIEEHYEGTDRGWVPVHNLFLPQANRVAIQSELAAWS